MASDMLATTSSTAGGVTRHLHCSEEPGLGLQEPELEFLTVKLEGTLYKVEKLAQLEWSKVTLN